MKNTTAKKIGRRAAGSYGRPGSTDQKRAASKAVRRATAKEVRELDSEAREYVDLMNSPPNAWNQNVHPTRGNSHVVLRRLYDSFGQDNANTAIARIFMEGVA